MIQHDVDELHQIIDAVHCPKCGAVAAVQAQTPFEVFDVWACATPDCPFNWQEGYLTWTLGLSG